MTTRLKGLLWLLVLVAVGAGSLWYLKTQRPTADVVNPTTASSPQPVLDNVTVDEDGTIRLKQ